MSPLDDQLRAALQDRAATLTPAPDPLAGIEARARGIRRRRVGASIAGAALAVAAVAVAVPTLTGSSPSKPSQVATPGPTTVSSAAVLDPAHPWGLRGPVLPTATAARFQKEWGIKHPGSTLTALFDQLYEPSQQQETAFVATGGGAPRFGLVSGSEGRANFLYDEPLADDTTALVFALPGDEVPRLLVVASPDTQRVEYAADGSNFRDITLTTSAGLDGSPGTIVQAFVPGIGLAPLSGQTADDRLRVTAVSGDVVYDEPAPDAAGVPSSKPSNLLTWPTRGETALIGPGYSVRTPVAQAFGRPGQEADARYTPLYTGVTDSGVRYTIGQAWMEGDTEAHTFGYAIGGVHEVFFGPVTAPGTAVVLFDLSNMPGSSREQLVVVPQPGTGQVLYDDNATGAFRPVTGQDALDGVVVIDRTPGDTDDRLQLLDGNGNTDAPTYQGPVLPLLCGSKECG